MSGDAFWATQKASKRPGSSLVELFVYLQPVIKATRWKDEYTLCAAGCSTAALYLVAG